MKAAGHFRDPLDLAAGLVHLQTQPPWMPVPHFGRPPQQCERTSAVLRLHCETPGSSEAASPFPCSARRSATIVRETIQMSFPPAHPTAPMLGEAS